MAEEIQNKLTDLPSIFVYQYIITKIKTFHPMGLSPSYKILRPLRPWFGRICGVNAKSRIQNRALGVQGFSCLDNLKDSYIVMLQEILQTIRVLFENKFINRKTKTERKRIENF